MSKRRVFLDVGGHVGETLGEVMKPRWGFDRIWSFEPVRECVIELDRIVASHNDDRVTIVPAGWWSSDTEMLLNNPGALNASIEEIAGAEASEQCRFIDAAGWMAENIGLEDEVWLKLNIEASEVAVLGRLLDTGEIDKIDHLVVHFDVELAGKFSEANAMRKRLNESDVPWREANRVMFGRTQEAKTSTWLAWTNGSRVGFSLNMMEHRARRVLWQARVKARRWARTARPTR
ncbi:MAG: hypothetical protein M9922_07125 [Microthrixaceae bacterium]|nr:hypothetical protein [Microthrixaceae bacterium]